MKKDERNNYGIENPDGYIYRVESKGVYSSNEKPKVIRENSSRSVSETERVDECQDVKNATRRRAFSSSAKTTQDGVEKTTQATVKAVQTTTFAGITAIGGLAATAVAAVIVVAYVAISMAVNVSLFFATSHSLTFLFDLQKLDKVMILAELSDGEEVYMKELFPEEGAFLTFEDLFEGREYSLTVRNMETNESIYTGTFRTKESDSGVEIFNAYLTPREGLCFGVQIYDQSRTFDAYTVLVYDSYGNSLYSADETEPEKFFEGITVEEKISSVLVAVKINGEIVAFSRAEWYSQDEPLEPNYDFNGAAWTWSKDEIPQATVTVRDLNGGEDLVLTPETQEWTEEPTCEEEGRTIYYATITDKYDEIYSSECETYLSLPALGHEYGELIPEQAATCTEDGFSAHYSCAVCKKLFDEDEVERSADYLTLPALEHEYGELIPEQAATCTEAGMAAHYCCATCEQFFDENQQEATEESLVLPALGHEYGELISEQAATCTEAGMAAHYCCATCEQFFDENQQEVTEESLVLPALDHDYSSVSWSWTEGEEPTALARFVCSRDADHFVDVEATVELCESTEADCATETNGSMTYRATVTFEEKEYSDEHVVIIPYSHTPTRVSFPQELGEVDYTTGTFVETPRATYVCSVCERDVEEECTVTMTMGEEEAAVTLTCMGETQDGYSIDFFDNGMRYSYIVDDDAFATVACDGIDDEFVVPDLFFGKPVTRVGANTFGGMPMISITLGANVNYIEAAAFADMSDLSSAILPNGTWNLYEVVEDEESFKETLEIAGDDQAEAYTVGQKLYETGTQGYIWRKVS